MKKQIIRSSLAGCLFALSYGVWADTFVLTGVRVNGLERISTDTVLSNISVKSGDKFDDKMTSELVRSLYKTGLFDDVRIARQGNDLLINVKERAAIGDLTVTGNEAIETAAIIDALKRAGIAKGRPLDKAALNRIEQEIRRQYLSNGNYSIDVTTTTKKLERNRVSLKIAIDEGAVARIKRVNISGNKAFTEKTLSKLFESGPKGKLAFFSSRDKYAKEKLVGDIDQLTSYYRDRGYLNFEVVSSQVSLSEDKRSVVININIKEGDQFTIGKVNIDGDTGLSQGEAQKLISLKEGEVFSQTKLTAMRQSIQDRLGEDGYAFARIGISPQVDNINKRVNINFTANKGQRAYVRRINITGNHKTKDEVFRREMRQLESAFLSKEKVDASKRRIQRLSYVESVRINTTPIEGRSDQVDIDVIVSETSSNQFTAGVGFSQTSGILFNLGLSQSNFLGTGQSFSINGERSDSTNRFALSFNDPYHTVDGVGRGFSVFYEESDAGEDNISDFESDAYGAEVSYTIPIAEDNSLRFSLGYEHREITLSDDPAEHIADFVDIYGDEYDNFIGKLSYIRDTRNRSLFPSDGSRQSINLEVGLPGSDLEYYKLNYSGASYFPLSDNLTFVIKGRVATGDGYGDTSDLPFYERFFLGGISTVRGFDTNSLGDRDPVSDDPIGGDFAVNGTAEVLFPVPFAKDVKGLRMSAFIDAGNVYEDIGNFDQDEIRYSAGLAATWISPLGPFTLSYAEPLNPKDGDDEQQLQFTIGTSF